MRVLTPFLSILALVCGLSSPSFAKDPDICLNNARQIVTIGELRDSNITELQVLESIDFDSISPDYRRQVEQDMRFEISKVYKSKASPMVVAKDYFERCLKQPDYRPEKQI